MNPVAGTVLEDRYTLTGLIAAGGMGEVWAANDAVLDRAVAVKLMNPTLSQRSGFLERFRAEARYSAGLDHPNITTVYDYGEDEGSAYLVMELVAGQPLSQIISERAPLSAPETASILIQAANALGAAHQRGVVHCDVKPANILITPDGTVKLTDFGISRLVGSEPRTQSSEVLGTAQYLSPEQTLGQPATASSDIYALGVVGHEMLTGQRPFDAETMVATAHAHISQPPPRLPDSVPPWLRAVISSALAKVPSDRPAGAAAMARALRVEGTAANATGNRSGMTQVMPVSAMPVSAMPVSAMPVSAMPVSAMPVS
ncbi:MAG TPA: serine/threonine-protein kinase, partial [Dermatophilaceae bacterium]